MITIFYDTENLFYIKNRKIDTNGEKFNEKGRF